MSFCDRPRILVVEDHPVNRKLLAAQLDQLGYEILLADSGEAALALANSAPDTVLLDVMMPGMNGFEVCRRLKANPATSLTPVIMLTALQQVEDRVEALD